MMKVFFTILLCKVASLLIKFTPRDLTRQCKQSTLNAIFTSFVMEETSVHEIATLLEFSEYDFSRHYHFEEPVERQMLLKRYFFHPEYHENIFSIEKLLNNPLCLDHMLDRSTFYSGTLLRRLRIELPLEHWFFTSESPARRALMRAAKSQLIRMEAIDLFVLYLSSASYQDLEWLFRLMADSMCPTLMEHFLDCLQECSLHGQVYNPKLFLANHYFTKDLTEEEVFLRFLTIRTTSIDHSSDFIPVHVRNRLIMKGEFGILQIIELVVRMSEDLHGITSLSILVILLDRCRNERIGMTQLVDWVKWLIKMVILGKLPPLLSRPLLRNYREVATPLEEIPELYRPIETWPLAKRRSLWLRSGPVILRDNLPQRKICAEDFVIESVYQRELPVNIQVRDADNLIWIGECVIQAVLDQPPSTEPNLSIPLVLAAWAYALVDGRRLDFAKQFQNGTPGSWREFLDTPELIPRDALVTTATILRALGFVFYFTPAELRELIDSSYIH
jgi:hypothetical protein